jgi:inorganic pyrophosphatase
MDLHELAPFDHRGRPRAVIESPQGSRNKLKYEPGLGTFRVTASLPAGMSFPFDFGFFPRTRSADGDPLDVLVLMDAPAYPGVAVTVRLLGVIEGRQTEHHARPYRNDRLIAIADGSTERGDLHRLADMDHHLMTQISSFFETYAGLTGKAFEATSERGPKRARRLLDAAVRRGGSRTEGEDELPVAPDDPPGMDGPTVHDRPPSFLDVIRGGSVERGPPRRPASGGDPLPGGSGREFDDVGPKEAEDGQPA